MIAKASTEQFVIVEPGEAFIYYRRFRQWLRSDHVGNLVSVRNNKPLTKQEVTYLVGYDIDKKGEMLTETCGGCKRKFNPVSWIDISDPNFLELIAQGKTIEEATENARPLIFGHYYLNTNDQDCDTLIKYNTFCGSPYFFNAQTQRYAHNDHSCIVAVKNMHPQKHWGICRSAFQYRIDEIERIREAKEAQRQETQARIADAQLAAMDLFGNGKPSRREKHSKR